MNLRIYPSLPQGTVSVPPSKSMAHRMLICAALAEGKSVIENVDFSEDISATCDCLRALGARVEAQGNRVTVVGCAGVVTPSSPLLCRESGSTLRFMIPLCLTGETVTLKGSPRLMERPLSVYQTLFEQRRISLTCESGSVSVCGRLTAGDYSVPGNVSSQFLTGLLFALPLCSGESRLLLSTPLESASYLLLTLSALRSFGITILRTEEGFTVPGNQTYKARHMTVEGDESNAAFFGLWDEVSLTGRNPLTLQGDRVWEDCFSRLKTGYCNISVADCPDLAPVLMAAAALNHGCRLTDTKRLKIKESDRGTVMAEELRKFGACVTVGENEIEIKKSPLSPPKQPLNGHNDHRIVMSLAVMCAALGGEIHGAQAVRKSYPAFFEQLKNLKVRLEEL